MHDSTPPTFIPLIGVIRDARYTAGIRCPRCDSHRVQRWGHFSGRQRFRCRGCARTFSDLTGTPAAYIKKLQAWDLYAACLRSSYSVRKAARIVRINPTTAFRWRHRLLNPMRDRAIEKLEGWIEIDSVRFAYSEKGSRKIWRPHRQRAARAGEAMFEPVTVLLACDRTGGAIAVQCWKRINTGELRQALDGNRRGRPTVTAAEGQYGPVATYTRSVKGRFLSALPRLLRNHGVNEKLVHTRTARDLRRRLTAWIARFRGVATKYLRNYLAWHIVVDREIRTSLAKLVFRWPLGRVARGRTN